MCINCGKLDDNGKLEHYCKVDHPITKKFIIPVGGMSKEEAEKCVRELMREYKEDVQWDESWGEVEINGKPSIPTDKEYWFPVKKDEK